MSDDDVTLEAELAETDAQREIAKAVSARHSVARKYVMRLRRRHPDATPAELIHMLERHYGTAISAAGALVSVGAIAADIGIGFIPGGGAAAGGAKSAGRAAVKQVGKEAAKGAAKVVARSAAKNGAQRAVKLLPAGDKQLQFELTAIFGLAIADIHGMNLDKDQAQALVYGLTNERVSQQKIATMAQDVANSSAEGVVGVGHRIAEGRTDWSHWANTLADGLPAGAAQSFVRTIETGQLNAVRTNLGTKKQAAVDYGVGALTGGVARFVFGRDVIQSSRVAFAAAPREFPAHLALREGIQVVGKGPDSSASRAVAGLESAAAATGHAISGVTGKAAGGVVGAAKGIADRFARKKRHDRPDDTSDSSPSE
ncbi:hypothetical protein AX769_11370 [Frondihabitans sp. PAMC 28766]|uniref:hypothetical protein n=1 Tax=Frondihabitans sp. PAMC 28766 TaxID=1795630 RepID=UPI00078E33D2|nr:hypothetical protein [Frondihabitans sp. PAMC 28766]AMM20631.1 hypothetical protein AX769_11370 [Frondihabitans sp. PAMC 28766]